MTLLSCRAASLRVADPLPFRRYCAARIRRSKRLALHCQSPPSSSGPTVSRRRALAVAIVATAALGEILASPSWLRSAFYAVDRDTVGPEPTQDVTSVPC